MCILQQELTQRDQGDVFLANARHDFPAIHDDEAVSDLVHVRQRVRDVNTGFAARFNLVDEVQHLAHFLERQRHRRLVEDDQLRFEVHRPANGDALTLAARKLAHFGVDRDPSASKSNRAEHDFFGDLFFFLHVDEAEAVGDLTPDEKVSPQGLLFAERFILIDRLDAVLVRLLDVVMSSGQPCALQHRVRRWWGETRPSGFSPSSICPRRCRRSSPTISLRPTSRLMSWSACTRPKCFSMLTIRRA